MEVKCSKIFLSDRAYNSIVSETRDKITTETGGILMGRIVNDNWYVTEVIDPGPHSIFSPTYFEYDTAYVNHLAKVISKQYEIELSVLGLWHRHPGSMDSFSSLDDITNSEFAEQHPKGAISGLVNIDPVLRLTIYHVDLPLKYTKTPFEVGDHFFPIQLLAYKYAFATSSDVSQILWRGKNLSYSRKMLNSFSEFLNSLIRFESSGHLNMEKAHEQSTPQDGNGKTLPLIDLCAEEEWRLENIAGVKYESTVEGDRLVYTISEYLNGDKIGSAISFGVTLDSQSPVFVADGENHPFEEGVFARYVEGKLSPAHVEDK